MENRDGEIHVETDEARGATNNNIVRWILLIGLIGAIAVLSIIWMTGALSQSEDEENVSVSRQINEATDDAAAGEATDSIVGEDADQLETAEPAADTAATPADTAAEPAAD
jgi:hypothetical protein